MKNKLFGVLVSTVLVAVMAAPLAVGALNAYLKIEGEMQGDIEGEVTSEGLEGSIGVLGFEHSVGVSEEYSTGRLSGKRQHSPFRITKEIDKSSPLLMKAMISGELLEEVELRLYRVNPYGSTEHYYTILLEDARVVSVKTYSDSSAGPIEEVSFNFGRISWTYEPLGISTVDDIASTLV